MERKVAGIVGIPHDSNLLTKGYKIKDMSRAKAMGMRIDLAKIKIANKVNTVAIAKNSF
jgi:hypothetical protein